MMDLLSKENIKKGKRTAKVLMIGQIKQSMMEIGKTINYTVTEFIIGLMGECLKVTGILTGYTEMVFTTGLTVASMKESISKIKSKVSASTYGLMEKSTKVFGLMASSMGKANSQTLWVSHVRENGKTETE